jgi:GNAT superfamily N-acetyltransferase
MTQVRAAVPEDAYDLARLHVRSWRSAYRGLISQEYLDSLTPEMWTDKYNFGRMGLRVPSTLVAVDGTTVCGLATTGLCRDYDLPDFGELMAIYVDPSCVRAGIGSLLITAARARLRGLGVAGVALWVMRENINARRFYERDGWKFDGTHRSEIFGNQSVDEVRYRARS